MQGLRDALCRLTGSQPWTDFELEKLSAEYRNLLYQASHREVSVDSLVCLPTFLCQQPPGRSPHGSSEPESPRNLRTEVLADLLKTVRHIKSDVEQADLRAERG